MKEQVGLHVKPENRYLWRVAKAVAKAQGITLSQLVHQAVQDYCINHQVPPLHNNIDLAEGKE